MAISDRINAEREKALAAAAINEGESEVHDPEKGSSYVRYAAFAWGEDDFREFLRETGTDPDSVTFTHGWTSAPNGGFWNKLNNVKKKILDGEEEGIPAWPVIQPATTVYDIRPITPTPRASKFKTAVIGADSQIGFDLAPDGSLVPYHDDYAIDIFQQVVQIENPQVTALAGDILDLAEQGRWAQEARFANTTQAALERGRLLAAETRARTNGKIIWIEGNHDKRMQGFMEANAKSAMGLKRAGYPESYPVMSLPNLIGLEDFDTEYIDAYPAGAYWLTNDIRIIHGTKSQAKGSTASMYSNETPHLSTIFGHSHRLEVQSKTIFDRAGKIRTMSVNPGCLCRVDGAVPSVHGARHLDGSKATYWENWQQGVAIVRYIESGPFYVELVQIDNGRGFYGGQELVAEGL